MDPMLRRSLARRRRMRASTGASAHPAEPVKTDRLGHLNDRLHHSTSNPSLFKRRKKGFKEPSDPTLGRSRGGLLTKIYMVCDANGVPLHFRLSPGQSSDIYHAQPLLDAVRIAGKPGRRVNVVGGCWMARDTMPNTCVSTATVTRCSWYPIACHAAQTPICVIKILRQTTHFYLS